MLAISGNSRSGSFNTVKLKAIERLQLTLAIDSESTDRRGSERCRPFAHARLSLLRSSSIENSKSKSTNSNGFHFLLMKRFECFVDFFYFLKLRIKPQSDRIELTELDRSAKHHRSDYPSRSSKTGLLEVNEGFNRKRTGE